MSEALDINKPQIKSFWKQVVLFASSNRVVRHDNVEAFGNESRCEFTDTMPETYDQFEKLHPDVIILDAQILPIDKHEAAESFKDFYKTVFQKNPKVIFIVLIKERTPLFKEISQHSQTTGLIIFLQKGEKTSAQIAFIAKVLRKRFFRTVIASDLNKGNTFPCELFKYNSIEHEYSIILEKNTPLTPDHLDDFEKHNVHHLYLKHSDLYDFLETLDRTHLVLRASEQLVDIKKRYRNILVQVFDSLTDLDANHGLKIHKRITALITSIVGLVNSFDDPYKALLEITTPRAGGLSHGVNCAIFSVIFSRHLGFKNTEEISFIALLHNIGLSETPKKIILKPESKMTPEERTEYAKHINKSIEIIKKKKKIPLCEKMEKMITQHHENYDGTGFPKGLLQSALLIDASLISLTACFDYFYAISPFKPAHTPYEAWQCVKNYHASTPSHEKFHPELIKKLDVFFEDAIKSQQQTE